VINEKAERLDQFSFTQDRGGFDYFLRRLEGVRQKHDAPCTVVAMEPSNYFWKLLAKELEEQKITYHLVNAYTVKKHREGNQLDRSKDDRRDAGQIAELSRNGHYTQTRLQKGAYEELRQYAALYHRLVQGIRCERQVLWGLVGQVFPNTFRYSGPGERRVGHASRVARAAAHAPDNRRRIDRQGTGGLYGKKLASQKYGGRIDGQPLRSGSPKDSRPSN
jgi:transposase